MTTAYERLKRSLWLGGMKDSALERLGITYRSSGVMGAAYVGTKRDGSVWVWDEITQEHHMVSGPGTVDPLDLPAQAPRGRAAGSGGGVGFS